MRNSHGMVSHGRLLSSGRVERPLKTAILE